MVSYRANDLVFPLQWDRLIRNISFGVGPKLSPFPAPALVGAVVRLGEGTEWCPAAHSVLGCIPVCKIVLGWYVR